jgi:hypothetical protein
MAEIKGLATGATVDRLAARLVELMENARGSVDAALYQEGLAVDALAVSKIPVDTGRLRATHYVSPPTDEGPLRSVVEVGFGTDYAVYVHEDTAARHVTGEAKFLEKAMNQRASGFTERLARRAKKLFEAGVSVVAIDGSTPTSPQDVGPIGPMLGPTRGTLIRHDKKERRARLKAKRAEKRKARREFKRRERAHLKQAKAAIAKSKKQAKREKRRTERAYKRKMKAISKKARKQAKREAKALAKARRRAQPKDFDF